MSALRCEEVVHLGKVTSWHNSGWLVVDAALEACRAPVYELNGPARAESVKPHGDP